MAIGNSSRGHVEYWSQSEKLKIRGYIDRIDVMQDDPHALKLIEFKTGGKWHPTQHKQELIFYTIMMNDLHPDYTIDVLGCYNPRLDMYDEWTVKESDIKRVKVKWNKVLDAIETMTFCAKVFTN